MRRLCIALTLAIACNAACPADAVRFETVYELHPGKTVYAYARISGSGRYLAYAAQQPPDMVRPEAIRYSPPIALAGGMSSWGKDIMEQLSVIDLKTRQVIFTEPGVDGFWSNDERRMIFLSQAGPVDRVSIWNRLTGKIVRDVQPADWGSYFSWGVRDGHDVILTILNYYSHLNPEGKAVLPPSRIVDCGSLGAGERPLLSHDGRRATVFIGGKLVVRNVSDCKDMMNTGIAGAKADFSWDGRYIAFHAPKKDPAQGYVIKIVDTKARTVRTLSGLKGSSLFPNWTRDGRVCFRYETDKFNGFMFAHNALAAPAQALPPAEPAVFKAYDWSQLFPETPRPSHPRVLVLIWGVWSPYSSEALRELQRLHAYLREKRIDVALMTAVDPQTRPLSAKLTLAEHHIALPLIPLAPQRFVLTEAVNQIPTTLLFEGDRLVDRRLGAQSFDRLREWLGTPPHKRGN